MPLNSLEILVEEKINLEKRLREVRIEITLYFMDNKIHEFFSINWSKLEKTIEKRL